MKKVKRHLLCCDCTADQSSALSVKPHDVTVQSVGDVAVFSCRLEGAPAPSTRWFHGDDAINTDSDDDDDDAHYTIHTSDNALSVLEVHTVREDDAGYFRCQAGNGVERSVVSRFVRLSFNESFTNRCKQPLRFRLFVAQL